MAALVPKGDRNCIKWCMVPKPPPLPPPLSPCDLDSMLTRHSLQNGWRCIGLHIGWRLINSWLNWPDDGAAVYAHRTAQIATWLVNGARVTLRAYWESPDRHRSMLVRYVASMSPTGDIILTFGDIILTFHSLSANFLP
jgi:hypothetical protein